MDSSTSLYIMTLLLGIAIGLKIALLIEKWFN